MLLLLVLSSIRNPPHPHTCCSLLCQSTNLSTLLTNKAINNDRKRMTKHPEHVYWTSSMLAMSNILHSCSLGRISDRSSVDGLCLQSLNNTKSVLQKEVVAKRGKIQKMMQKLLKIAMFKQALHQKNIYAFLSLFIFIIRWSEDVSWISNGTYWELRDDPGFSKLEFPVLWWPDWDFPITTVL